MYQKWYVNQQKNIFPFSIVLVPNITPWVGVYKETIE